MEIVLIILFIIAAGIVGRFIYTRFSGRATLERLTKKYRDEIKTEEDIYQALMMCVSINGTESKEEFEEGLQNSDRTMTKLQESGFGCEVYKNLSDTNKRIYLIINEHPSLIPEYLLAKAMNSCWGQSNDQVSGANEFEECVKGKTNFMHPSTAKADEKKEFIEIGAYLISIGKYPNELAMEKDAKERVTFFDEMGLYSQDPQLVNASQYRKQIHALIYAHELHDVIVANNGYLPCK